MNETTTRWQEALRAHIASQPVAPLLPDGHMLHALQTWQRRITGGSLLEFLEWVASDDAKERYPALVASPASQRVLVFVSDVPGLVAFREIVDHRSPHVIGLLKAQWRAFLDDTTQDHDEALHHHYEVWSVWHRDIDPHWDMEGKRHDQLWVHEEGFAIADEAGRGSQNLWNWNGQEMQLVKQDMSKWVY